MGKQKTDEGKKRGPTQDRVDEHLAALERAWRKYPDRPLFAFIMEMAGTSDPRRMSHGQVLSRLEGWGGRG